MKHANSLKYLSLLSILFFLSLSVVAQPGKGQRGDRYQQIESQRIAFITTELSLTPEEAQEFWPVYNEYNTRRNQMMIRHRNDRKEERNLENLSEQELIEIADADIGNMEEMIALRRQYHEKFKEILPVKKVIQLYNAERDFNRKLYREGRGRSDAPNRRRN